MLRKVFETKRVFTRQKLWSSPLADHPEMLTKYTDLRTFFENHIMSVPRGGSSLGKTAPELPSPGIDLTSRSHSPGCKRTPLKTHRHPGQRLAGASLGSEAVTRPPGPARCWAPSAPCPTPGDPKPSQRLLARKGFGFWSSGSGELYIWKWRTPRWVKNSRGCFFLQFELLWLRIPSCMGDGPPNLYWRNQLMFP